MPKAQYRLPLWALKVVTRLSGRPTGVSDELRRSVSDLGCIFIHIPKCAGNAVQKSLFGEVVFGHQTIRQYQVALPKVTYQNAWKFTIVRDPFERVASAWRFLKAGGLHKHDADYFAENLSRYASFDHFVNSAANPSHVLLLILKFLDRGHKFGEVIGHVGLVLYSSPVTLSREELSNFFKAVFNALLVVHPDLSLPVDDVGQPLFK